MKHLRINSKKVKVPESWDELTWAQWQMLKTMPNDLAIVAYFFGMKPEELKSYKKLKNYFVVKAALSFLDTVPSSNKKPKDFLKLNDVPIAPKLDLLDMSIGQYQDMVQVARNENYNENDVIELVAMFLQPSLNDGIYDAGKADELKGDIACQLSVQDILDLQSFFLKSVTKSKPGIMQIYSNIATLLRKSLQVFQI